MDRQWEADILMLLKRADERKNAGKITPHFQARTRNSISQLVRKVLKEEPEGKNKVVTIIDSSRYNC